MGIFSGIIGNVSEMSIDQIIQEFGQLLGENEAIDAGYKLIRDAMIFTNKRIIFIDKQGVTAKKIEYMSIPYKSIERFSVETAGHFDLDAELKLWVRGMPEPIEQQFNSKVNIYEVQSIISKYI